MKAILTKLFSGKTLSFNEAKNVMLGVSTHGYNNAQLAAFMSVFLMRAIAPQELSGFSAAIRETQTKLNINADNAVDIVGTGGDGKDTFNISTLSCFVLAGASYKVVKHGNYGASSASGASNALENCGAKFTNNPDILQRSLDESNMLYMHAPLFNSALKVVASARKELGVRTFFNLLGPLLNPLKPKNMLLGVYSLKLVRLYKYILENTVENYAIVHSLDGYDEISLTGKFKIASSKNEGVFTPEDLGLPRCKQSDLGCQSNAQIAKEIFIDVLNCNATPQQENCVLANSAAAIGILEKNKSFAECLEIARESLRGKKALACFKKYLEINK